MVAGMSESARYTGGNIRLSPGETLFLYTDGVTEAFDAEEEMFDDDRLVEAVEGGAALSVDGIVRSVLSKVKAFSGSAPQSDDVTAMAVRYFGR